MGAYAVGGKNPFAEWYARTNGRTMLTIPKRFGDGGMRTPGFAGQPAHPEPVQGKIHDQVLVQYDFTPQQYAALAKLVATVCTSCCGLNAQISHGRCRQVDCGKNDRITNWRIITACWGIII